MEWSLFFNESVYRLTSIDQSGGVMDVAVHFAFAWTVGYHVKVYCRNAMIGDCIHEGEPTILAAYTYAQKYLDSPTDYNQLGRPWKK